MLSTYNIAEFIDTYADNLDDIVYNYFYNNDYRNYSYWCEWYFRHRDEVLDRYITNLNYALGDIPLLILDRQGTALVIGSWADINIEEMCNRFSSVSLKDIIYDMYQYGSY